jgi:hypothetical protein
MLLYENGRRAVLFHGWGQGVRCRARAAFGTAANRGAGAEPSRMLTWLGGERGCGRVGGNVRGLSWFPDCGWMQYLGAVR